MNKKFSILTSCYNQGNYLFNWSESILSQSYRPLEVVFVDDCSRKHESLMSIALAEDRFREKGIELVTIRNNKNLGCSSSYLAATEKASGDYCGIVDSDDCLFDKDSVSSVMKAYDSSGVDWIYTHFNIHQRNMEYHGLGFSRCPVDKSLLMAEQFGEHFYSHWRTFSKRIDDIFSVFKVGLRSSADKFMGYRLEELGSGGFLKKICYNYRAGSFGNISNRGMSEITWRQVINESVQRRHELGIEPFPIVEID